MQSYVIFRIIANHFPIMKKRKVPHTFVIVFCCILLAAMLTWFIKPGKYVTEVVDGQSVSMFYYQDQLPQPYAAEFHAEPQTWQVFSALYRGFEKQSGIIVFILIVGGAFWIMNKSKAIDTGIMAFLRFTKRLEHNRFIRKIGVNNIIITLIMILFSLFGSVFGMSEETIAFTLIVIPLVKSDWSGGLERTLVLMDYQGDTLKVWEGKFDIRDSGADNQVFFDFNGKRVWIQGGIVVSEEH